MQTRQQLVCSLKEIKPPEGGERRTSMGKTKNPKKNKVLKTITHAALNVITLFRQKKNRVLKTITHVKLNFIILLRKKKNRILKTITFIAEITILISGIFLDCADPVWQIALIIICICLAWCILFYKVNEDYYAKRY